MNRYRPIKGALALALAVSAGPAWANGVPCAPPPPCPPPAPPVKFVERIALRIQWLMG